MFLKLFLILIILISLALLALGIGMLIKKNGKFPETHIGRNKEMKKRGINCAQSSDRKEREGYTPVRTQEREGE